MITMSTDYLVVALKNVSGFIGKTSMPVLECARITLESDKLVFRATNLERAIQSALPHEWANIRSDGEPFDLCVDPKKLAAIARNGGGKIDLKPVKNQLHIKMGEYACAIATMPASEFPPLDDRIENGVVIPLDWRTVQEVMGLVGFAASTDSARQTLNGVHIKAAGKKMSFEATDGFRISRLTVEAEQDLPVTDVIAQVNLFKDARFIHNETALVITDTFVSFISDPKEIRKNFVSVIRYEGSFPNIEQVAPKESKTIVTLKTSELHNILLKIRLFAKENNNIVRLKFSGDKLHISAANSEGEFGESEIAADIDGRDIQLAVNVEYLIEVLSGLSRSKNVKFGMNTDSTPILITAEDRADYMHVLMPMHLG